MIKTVTIFRKKVDLTNDVEFEFQSLGFLFEVTIKNLNLKINDIHQVMAVRLTLNRSITANIDCTLSSLGTIKIELQILKRLFNTSQALNILENIDND